MNSAKGFHILADPSQLGLGGTGDGHWAQYNSSYASYLGQNFNALTYGATAAASAVNAAVEDPLQIAEGAASEQASQIPTGTDTFQTFHT